MMSVVFVYICMLKCNVVYIGHEYLNILLDVLAFTACTRVTNLTLHSWHQLLNIMGCFILIYSLQK